MKSFFKSKTDVIQNVVIGILFLVIFLSNFSLVAQFLGKLNPLVSYQKRLDEATEGLKRAEERNTILEFDRVRLEDVSNILLAIQDYYFQKNVFPESLDDLKKGGYLDPNSRLIDSGTNQPYFYQKREKDFVLCIWLSDMLKGVNTTSCPLPNSKEPSATEQKDQKETVAPVENKTVQPSENKVKIVGHASVVNVREQPTISSAIIAKIVPGDTYIFTEQQGDWYHIVVSGQKDGWVRKDYAEPLITE